MDASEIFKNGEMVHLMIIEKNDKQVIPKRLDMPIYRLLSAVLSMFGIKMMGATYVGQYAVRGIAISPDFDYINEPILQQLYSFSHGVVNISLYGIESQYDCAYSFAYSLDTHTCTLHRFVHYNVAYSKEYSDLESMIKDLRLRGNEL